MVFIGKAFISALFLSATNLANSTTDRNIAAIGAHGYVYDGIRRKLMPGEGTRHCDASVCSYRRGLYVAYLICGGNARACS